MNSDFVNNWASQVKKGTLSFIVLNILRKKEVYGYELIEEIKKFTAIEIAEGTLYPLMNRLKKENLVASKWVEQETGIPRKYYSLTKKGVSTLAEMQAYWTNLEKVIYKLQK
ncbi:MAG: PadR family transcriptional regulator [Bacteroidetes bacterium]|nr:PadR family transcriptional regulator [Bacteroidota bacterium]